MNFVEMLLVLVMLVVIIGLLTLRDELQSVEMPELPMITGPNWATEVDN
jgi:hypothetical protein